MEALETFMTENSDFVSDTAREKFFVTQNPRGYLKRIRPQAAVGSDLQPGQNQ